VRNSRNAVELGLLTRERRLFPDARNVGLDAVEAREVLRIAVDIDLAPRIPRAVRAAIIAAEGSSVAIAIQTCDNFEIRPAWASEARFQIWLFFSTAIANGPASLLPAFRHTGGNKCRFSKREGVNNVGITSRAAGSWCSACFGELFLFGDGADHDRAGSKA
jgi:hypothetical protein